jgi:chromosome segregation protein
MYLKSIELAGFKSFGRKSELHFGSSIASIVGPNGSGKSNVAEAFRFVLGEQSMKAMRGKRGEDMIWSGSPGLTRGNRAAVKVTFDNSSRLLDLDFNEVVIERAVYRDGQNEYLLNGTQVRLKDVIRLLAGANIGGSGYQIISQGEADRILNASPKERREMVEDALGLKLFQHKKAESERKLEETATNIDKTKSLRREIAPHLRFLQGQVEKIEKARELKEELAHKLADYLAREHAWITQEGARLSQEHQAFEHEAREHEEKLRAARAALAPRDESASDAHRAVLHDVENGIADARRRRQEISRELGRAEGALQVSGNTTERSVPAPAIRQFAREVTEGIEQAEREEDIGAVRHHLGRVRSHVHSFVEGLTGAAPVGNTEAAADVERLQAELQKIDAEEQSLNAKADDARRAISAAREASLVAERDIIGIEGALREVRARASNLHAARAVVAQAREKFEEEVREGIVLVGMAVHSWEKSEIPDGALSEDRGMQERRRRDIERLKIKIEESGIAGGDAVVKEFNHTRERDEFLARELTDLDASAESLRGIIADLEKTIDARFVEGLGKINHALHIFFNKLFNGGDAKLTVEAPRTRKAAASEEDDEEGVVDEEENLYAGLSISVSLPRKKVRGLEVLSGGERALTSIALIFSMSQVNPPPFLILDETDAALDEANSKRYADMIRELGQKSQLIVITHNRATMAAAGELFGVTMGQDGVSKLLSVKLEDAERVAK